MLKVIKRGQYGMNIIPLQMYNASPISNQLTAIPKADTSKLKPLQFQKSPYSNSTILGRQFNWDATQGNKFKQAFNTTNIGSTMSLAGGVADTLGGLIPKKEQSALTTGLNQGYDTAANAAMAIPGVGTIIGGAMKVGGMLSDGLTALGVGTDQMTTADKILDSKFLKLTPVGLINAFGARKTNSFTKDKLAAETVGSSYTGTLSTADKASKIANKSVGLFSSTDKFNKQIEEAKRQQNIMANIGDIATDRYNIQSGTSDINNRRYAFNLLGGYQQGAIKFGKSGLKVISDSQIDRAKALLAQNGAKKPKYQDGGKMNVIPEGALHARLNHMDVDNITKKGIPVITEENGGEITQHAEIEKEEIIFTKEVTDQLEKLYKIGTDKAAIEAGKLLAIQIIENTQDNTGLMKEVV